MPTWVPSTCPVCGGLRDGEDGPPWPFHAKGFHACECDDEETDQPITSKASAVLDPGDAAGGARPTDGEDSADSP